MAESTSVHRINRAEIELMVPDVALAEALLERVSQLRESRIAPMIDRVCNELSRSGQVDRVERLEIDLGFIAIDRFDDEFIDTFELALRAALAAQLSHQRAREGPEQSALDLVETFARTGNLPWWGDARDNDLVPTHLEALARHAPRELSALLRALADDPLAITRVAKNCNAATLEAIIEHARAGGQQRTGTGDRGQLLEDRHVHTGVENERPLQRRIAVLSALASRGWPSPDPAAAGLMRGPSSLGREAVPAALARSTLSAPASLEGYGPAAATPSIEPSVRVAAGLDRPAVEVPAGGPPRAVEHASGVWVGKREPGRASSAAVATHPQAAPRSVAREAHPEANGLAAARRRALEKLDQLYVEDAGLVLLWPFLEHFFRRVGLLDGWRGFVDEQASMQAIALLQQLALEEPEPPEFRLPLAKLICGVSPEVGVALDRPLEPEQLAECAALLGAVIAHAPVLRAMPIPSFRQIFLQRRGALSIRDGAWLLQVEQQAEDELLARFPWSWSWVKLPWMASALRVEW